MLASPKASPKATKRDQRLREHGELIEFILSQVDEQLGAGEMKNVVHHTVNQVLIQSFFKVTPRSQKIKLKPPQITHIMNDMQIG